MTIKDMQNLNRDTIKYISSIIKAGMTLCEIRNLCEKYLLSHGADSFWYWDVGAFVFCGKETAISVSGREYKTSDIKIEENDIITIDLSPQNNNIWGDYARTIIRASLKTPFEKKQLCTTSISSTSLGVRKHAFGRFSYSCHTYLLFL